jgi:hypothetical protein
MLRRLEEAIPTALIRAFADDTAMVVTDFFEVAGPIKQIFDEYAAISGMELNLPKTVVVPLWPQPLNEIKEQIANELPQWSGVDVAGAGRYLGFMEGPGKGDSSWSKANRKFAERAAMWKSESLGLQYSAAAYNTYAVTVLSYLSQLEDPPEETYSLEATALRQAAVGPGNWASQQDLWHLRECYGQAKSFRSIRIAAWSAQVRAATLEDLSRDEKLQNRAVYLRHLFHSAEFFGRRLIWRDWYNRSHVLVLVGAVDKLRESGIKLETILYDQSRTKLGKPLKTDIQRAVAEELIHRGRPDVEERIRAKLVRWRLPGPPAHVAERVRCRLTSLANLVTPRVAAACFSTIWNRWTTARRFQKRHRQVNHCMLGCEGGAEDSIEHYCRCSTVRSVAAKYLRLWPDMDLQTFMLADARLQNDDSLICVAIIIYATFMATNRFRQEGGASQRVANDALEQYCRNAVKGHLRSQRVVDSRWSGACGWTPPRWTKGGGVCRQKRAQGGRSQSTSDPVQASHIAELSNVVQVTEMTDARAFCEPECNDLPVGQHHPMCSQAFFMMEAQGVQAGTSISPGYQNHL